MWKYSDFNLILWDKVYVVKKAYYFLPTSKLCKKVKTKKLNN